MSPVLLLLAACHSDPKDTGRPPRDSTPDQPDSAEDSATDSQGSVDSEDSAADTSPPGLDTSGWEEENTGGMDPDLSSWIFSDTEIHHIDITLPDTSVTALYAAPYDPAPGDVTFDGETVPDAGVRLRGKIGSFRDLSGKPKFELRFDAFVDDQEFYGLKSINLNSSVVDCSFLKEPLGYRIAALAGVPAERTGFAWVTVNGSDYGLYTLIEDPNIRFLEHTYPDPTGNLYDGKYVWYGGWNYILLDFNSGVDDYFQLEEGTDVGHADIYAVSAAIGRAAGGGAFERGLAPVLNWDEFHRELAFEQYIGQNDWYALNQNNYRVYFDPTDGKMQMIPWDLDYAFLHDSDWGMSWYSPRGQLAAWCFRDVGCADSSREAMRDLVAAVDPVALLAWYEEVSALTWDSAMRDPRKECSSASVGTYQDYLRSWISTSNDTMTTWWGL